MPRTMLMNSLKRLPQPDGAASLANRPQASAASRPDMRLARVIKTRLRACLAACTLLLSAAPALAHDARIGALHIFHPAAPATLPGQNSGVVYLSIENEGSSADRLRSASSPAADAVSIHKMSMDGGIMRMREIDDLPLPPSSKVSLKADGAYHLMMTGLKHPMAVGDKIPLTLVFERAGKVEVSVHVGPNATQPASGTHQGMGGMEAMPGH